MFTKTGCVEQELNLRTPARRDPKSRSFDQTRISTRFFNDFYKSSFSYRIITRNKDTVQFLYAINYLSGCDKSVSPEKMSCHNICKNFGSAKYCFFSVVIKVTIIKSIKNQHTRGTGSPIGGSMNRSPPMDVLSTTRPLPILPTLPIIAALCPNL